MKYDNLTNEELLIFAAEANSNKDQKLIDEITDELKKRNLKEQNN
jgi:hypothetical protein